MADKKMHRRQFEEKHVEGGVSSSDNEVANVSEDTKTTSLAHVRSVSEI